MLDDKASRRRYLERLSQNSDVYRVAILLAIPLAILFAGVIGSTALLAGFLNRSGMPIPQSSPSEVATIVIIAGALGVFGLAADAIGFYTSGSKAQAYRSAVAALFVGLAAVLYVSDPSWNMQNVVMGIAVFISIAAIVVPLLRQAPESDPPEAAPRAGRP